MTAENRTQVGDFDIIVLFVKSHELADMGTIHNLESSVFFRQIQQRVMERLKTNGRTP